MALGLGLTNRLGLGLSSGGGGPVGPTGLLRAVSPYNLMNTQSPAVISSRNYMTGRYPHYIGSGDCSELRVLVDNFIVGLNNTANSGSAWTIDALYLEDATGAVPPVQVLFSGSGTITLTDGQADVVSDAILPASMSKTKFTRGEKYFLRYIVHVTQGTFTPAVTHNIPTMSTGASAAIFDSAVTTINNIASNGTITVTGTALTTSRNPALKLLGKFVTGDPGTYGGLGDSIMQSAGGSTGDAGGYTPAMLTGWFSRCLWDVPSVTNPRGGINFGFSGGISQLWVSGSAKLLPYTKYLNRFIWEYGENDFPTQNAANTGNVSALLTRDRGIYTAIRAAALVSGGRDVLIAHTKYMPITIGAWTLADGSDQTATWGPQFNSGGDCELFDDANFADVGVAGRLDAWIDWAFVRLSQTKGAANYYKWGLTPTSTPRTSDGRHPSGSPTLTTLDELAAVARTWIQSVD